MDSLQESIFLFYLYMQGEKPSSIGIIFHMLGPKVRKGFYSKTNAFGIVVIIKVGVGLQISSNTIFRNVPLVGYITIFTLRNSIAKNCIFQWCIEM